MTIDISDALKAAPTDSAPRIVIDDPKILILDIERLPGLTPIFDQRVAGGFIPVRKWRRLPSLLCFAAKWYGQRKVEFRAVWDEPDVMIERTWQLYDEADIVVGYNSIRFDNRHLRTEWLLAGYAPPRPSRNVDLFAINKRLFGFESKSLDHLCHRLGLDTKAGHYDDVQAELCLEGDVRAQRLMKRYNVGDVRITEQAYDRMRPWLSTHPHVNHVPARGLACNACGSEKLEPAGEYQALTRMYPQFRCQDCGNVLRGNGGYTIAKTRGVSDQ